MAWRVELSGLAQMQLESLEHAQAHRIVSFLNSRLAALEDPRSIGEPLKGPELNRFWKYRVSDYRLIARIEDLDVCVLVIRSGYRRNVYR